MKRNMTKSLEVDTTNIQSDTTPLKLTQSSVYRYKLSNDMLDHMKQFADIHNLDDLETFKKEYDKWYHDQNVHINKEYDRLQKLGYTGDLKQKIFKSVRYYYAKKGRIDKKSNTNTNTLCKPKRTKTCIVTKSMFECMDRVIMNHTHEKPSLLFQTFLDLYQEEDDIHSFIEEHETKLKKSFKNRMFKLKKLFIYK